MTCALEGVHRTDDGLFTCDGETHMTIHQPNNDIPAVYTYQRCPDWECPDGPSLPTRDVALIFGLIFASVLLWGVGLGMTIMSLINMLKEL